MDEVTVKLQINPKFQKTMTKQSQITNDRISKHFTAKRFIHGSGFKLRRRGLVIGIWNLLGI
jgi:hypothetical protein